MCSSPKPKCIGRVCKRSRSTYHSRLRSGLSASAFGRIRGSEHVRNHPVPTPQTKFDCPIADTRTQGTYARPRERIDVFLEYLGSVTSPRARKMWFLPRNGHGDTPAACYVGAGKIKSIQAAPHVHGAHFCKHIEPVKVKIASSVARCAFGPAESGTRSRRKIQRRCSILIFCGFLFFLEV